LRRGRSIFHPRRRRITHLSLLSSIHSSLLSLKRILSRLLDNVPSSLLIVNCTSGDKNTRREEVNVIDRFGPDWIAPGLLKDSQDEKNDDVLGDWRA
jgi:hypothetical protein